VGRPLGEELSGIYSARLAREWRVLYQIDEESLVGIVLGIVRLPFADADSPGNRTMRMRSCVTPSSGIRCSH
jgi:hypothetical protein